MPPSPTALDAGLRGLVHAAAREVHAAADTTVDALVAATAGLADQLLAALPTHVAALPADEAAAALARARARSLRLTMATAATPLAHTLVAAMRLSSARLHPLAETLDLLAPERPTLAPTVREVERALQDALTADGADLRRVADQLTEALGITAAAGEPDALRPLLDPAVRAARLRPVCVARFLRLLDPFDAWLDGAA